MPAQYDEHISKYGGSNAYQVFFTGSDKDNARRGLIEARRHQYIVNPGQCFDDNRSNLHHHHAQAFDHVQSISDDDLFAMGAVNPLEIIDVPLRSKKRAILLNHASPNVADDGEHVLGHVFYRMPRRSRTRSSQTPLLANPVAPRRDHVFQVTRCRSTGRDEALPQVPPPLCGASAPGCTGRWCLLRRLPAVQLSQRPEQWCCLGEQAERLRGPVDYLQTTRARLPDQAFEAAKAGFFTHHLRNEAELRKKLFSAD